MEGNGGTEEALERGRQLEAEEESSLKRHVKIMKTNDAEFPETGRTSFARRLSRDSAAPQQVLGLETEGSLRHVRRGRLGGKGNETN